jgi:glycogen debranching enzyme
MYVYVLEYLTPLINPLRLPTDFTKAIQVDLPISHAGAFVYWVEYDGDAPGERVKGREGYFNIDPILRVRARSPILSIDLKPLLPSEGGTRLLPEYVNLPLDGIAMLTVVSKWMGPISRWKKPLSGSERSRLYHVALDSSPGARFQ